MDTTFPIKTKHPDGVHTLPKGARIHITNGRAMEIWAPRKPDPSGWGTTAQRDAEKEAGEFLEVEISPAFWRVDHDWYVQIFPRAFEKQEAA
jgi:hypothetical protein